MNRRVIILAVLAAAILGGPPAQAAIGPHYAVKAYWSDTNLPPGGEGKFTISVRNVGDESGEETLILKDQLPEGVKATKISITLFPSLSESAKEFCSGWDAENEIWIETETVECVFPEESLAELIQAPGVEKGSFNPEPSGYLPEVEVDVAIDSEASGTGTNTAIVEGGGAAQPASDVDQVAFSAAPSGFGLVPGSFAADVFSSAFPFGEPARQAGDHPFEQRVDFDLNLETRLSDGELTSDVNAALKTVEVSLPRGMIGNPEATPKCDPVDFAQVVTTANGTACPSNTQVGYLNISTTSGEGPNIRNILLSRVPIFNLEPPRGVPADFAFNAGAYVQAHIYFTLDPAQDYAIKSVTPNISSLAPLRGSEVTIWGVPGDPAHDFFRFYPEVTEGNAAGAPFGGAAIRPLATNPTDCGFDNGGARIRIDSYSEPGNFTPVEEHGDSLNVAGCDDPRFRFEPDITLQPTSTAAGGPTGLNVNLKVPQRDDRVSDATELYAEKENRDLQGIATPPMKKAVVTFPEGMTISPSAAQGLGSCSSAQIGLETNDPVTCPDNSQYGELIIHTPILPETAPPKGFIYIAKQNDHPFHDSFLALYLVIEEPERGILVKVPGKVELDPDTGQITTTFDELPQFPVSDMQMNLKGGVRAGLVNPSTCGTKTIRAEFFSWHDPGSAQVVTDSYQVTHRPDGSPCVNHLAERPFGPQLTAGTLNNTAGSYSPFALRLTRTDDEQEFSQLGVTMPEGLIGKLAGVGECPQAGIARAISRTGAGQGALEQADPSCPASSLIGTTQVGVGVGVPLTYVPGNVYLAGPHNRAPLSIVVISPAVVGPYDLGVIAVRTALRIDPETTQVTATSDPFPQIFQGIPVRIRDIRLMLDREQFTLNPTSCAEKQIAARVTGTGGDLKSTADDTAADLANRFQAADCASLAFKPRLGFRLFGGTKRGAHPKLRAVVRMPKGGANMARASVALPRSEFLDQSHIRTVCTRVQFAQNACPKGSIYGTVKAKTPLLDEVVSGPIYLRSSDNLLPDLVAAFRGGKVDANVIGRIDSVRGGIRNTFELLPDIPVHWAVFTFQGGKKGLLVNSRNLCAPRLSRALAKFTAHNGKELTLRPKMQSACSKHSSATRKKRRRH